MPAERPPTLAALLTIAGGALIVAGALVLWRLGTVLTHVFGLPSPWSLGGAAAGILAVAAGGSMGVVPGARRTLGALALACAVTSIPLAFGGFVVGFVLTAVGGAIAAARPGRRAVVAISPYSSGPSPPWT